MGKDIWLHPFSMGYLASIMNQKWRNKKQDLQAGESWCKNSNSTTLEQKKKEKKTVKETELLIYNNNKNNNNNNNNRKCKNVNAIVVSQKTRKLYSKVF